MKLETRNSVMAKLRPEHQDGAQGALHALGLGHGVHGGEGHDERQGRHEAARHLGELHHVQARGLGEGHGGDGEGAEGHGARVGHEAHQRGHHGVVAQADEDAGGNGHGRAEAADALEEGAEAEGDEQGLRAAVHRQVRHGALHLVHPAGGLQHVVDHQRAEGDVHDGEDAREAALEGGQHRDLRREVEHEDRREHRHQQGDGRHFRGGLHQQRDADEQNDKWQRGCEDAQKHCRPPNRLQNSTVRWSDHQAKTICSPQEPKYGGFRSWWRQRYVLGLFRHESAVVMTIRPISFSPGPPAAWAGAWASRPCASAPPARPAPAGDHGPPASRRDRSPPRCQGSRPRPR